MPQSAASGTFHRLQLKEEESAPPGHWRTHQRAHLAFHFSHEPTALGCGQQAKKKKEIKSGRLSSRVTGKLIGTPSYSADNYVKNLRPDRQFIKSTIHWSAAATDDYHHKYDSVFFHHYIKASETRNKDMPMMTSHDWAGSTRHESSPATLSLHFSF